MTDPNLTAGSTSVPVRGTSRGLRNFLKYSATRLTILSLTVVGAVYLTILIANMGGYVDELKRGDIVNTLMGMMMGGWLDDVADEAEQVAIFEETKAAMEEAAGLNEPFLWRTFLWLRDGLTLNWGTVSRPGFYSTNSRAQVGEAILEKLSRTLLVFGTANVLLFLASVSISLALVRRYGGWLDRLFAALSPFSAAPAWVYGVILSVVLLRVFGFTGGGKFDTWPADFKPAYIVVMLRHLTIPFLAIFVSGLFQGVYAWRSFFLVYASEDYVEMARAKGLRQAEINRRYILHPAMPALLTSFALLAMTLWQEVIALEYFFNVEGIGKLLIQALQALDTPMIVSLVVTFAYLLAVTVFVLDILYALLDPRIGVGGGERQAHAVTKTARLRRAGLLHAISTLVRTERDWLRFLLAPFGLLARLVRGLVEVLLHGLVGAGNTLVQLLRVPSAAFGLSIILLLVAMSFHTVITFPVDEAIARWRIDDELWLRAPRNALPTWINLFRKGDLPPTLTFDADYPRATQNVEKLSEEATEYRTTYPFDYPYSGFPQELLVDVTARYAEKKPHVTVRLQTPDGREVRVFSQGVLHTDVLRVSREDRLRRRLGDPPEVFLFADPESSADEPVALQGSYTLSVEALVFEPDSSVDAEVVILGQVYGLAGTDANRRDMMIALQWGAPIALAFGLVAAIATSVGGMVFAAIGAWFGGWLDRLVQALTEINLILPFFPVSLMIFTLYSKSIWAILGVTVALTVFGSNVKLYRATFLQVMKAPYVEAAQAYGARNWRIVSRYLVPRIVAVLIPKIVILVPFYVFLEATLAFLGVSDPLLPTWGKLVVAALSQGVYIDAPHVVLFPLGVLFLTGFAFAMVGVALERIFEPRLQDR